MLQNPLLILMRNAAIAHCVGGPLSRFLAQIISQTAIRYPRSPIVVEKALFIEGESGTKAPNAPLFLHGQPSDLYSLLPGSTAFHLLLFSGNGHLIWAAPKDAKQLLTIRYCHLIDLGNDSSGRAHRIYGV